MAKDFSEFTKVFYRPCIGCGRNIAILVGSNIPQGEIVSARCPDCTEKWKGAGLVDKVPEGTIMPDSHCGLLPGSDDVKFGPGGGVIPYEERQRKF